MVNSPSSLAAINEVLREYLEHYDTRFEIDLKGIRGALNKLRKLIWSHINVYATDRVFAKSLLIDVRSFSDYYTSRPYELVKRYSQIMLGVIEEGVAAGEIRRQRVQTAIADHGRPRRVRWPRRFSSSAIR